MDNKYHFDVSMACQGCANSIDRVLNRLDSNSKVNIDLEKQTVDVVTGADYDSVYNTIAKTGKKINQGNVVT